MSADDEGARYTGELSPDISASDYTQRMSALRDIKPRPVLKMWRNPDLHPPEIIEAHKAKIRAWNSEYRKVSKNQKLALERDNEAFRKKYEVGKAFGGRTKKRADRR